MDWRICKPFYVPDIVYQNAYLYEWPWLHTRASQQTFERNLDHFHIDITLIHQGDVTVNPRIAQKERLFVGRYHNPVDECCLNSYSHNDYVENDYREK